MSTAVPTPANLRALRVLGFFIAVEILCQLALLVPALNAGPVRVLWRVGVFALSLFFLVAVRGRARSSPPAVAALWVVALLVLEIFHPTSNSWLAAGAECAMNLAILAPLFWVGRLRFDRTVCRRALLLFWAFYTASAVAGILQVHDPGRFQPRLSPIVASMGADVAGLKITLANGHQVFRPMGLTDMPGGAASAGLWAVLFGLAFLLTSAEGARALWKRVLFALSMVAGMMCMVLSQTRVLLVVVAVWFAVLVALLLWRRRWRQLAMLVLLGAVIAAAGLSLSVAIGGRGVSRRLATVASTSAAERTYAQERGLFLSDAFRHLLPRYPLGAGLGRWGMMNTYFGNNRDPRRGLIYVEIQWQGWVLDGGAPLLAAYLLLLGLTLLALARIARRGGPMAMWASVCLAYDVAMLAFTFDATPFTGELGLEFWFINALVLTAAASIAAERPGPVAPPRTVARIGA